MVVWTAVRLAARKVVCSADPWDGKKAARWVAQMVAHLVVHLAVRTAAQLAAYSVL